MTDIMSTNDRRNEQMCPAMSGTFARGFEQNWATPLVNIPDAMKLAKEPWLLDLERGIRWH